MPQMWTKDHSNGWVTYVIERVYEQPRETRAFQPGIVRRNLADRSYFLHVPKPAAATMYANLVDAQVAADQLLSNEDGHTCSGQCGDWQEG